MILALAVPQISLGPQNLVGQVTLTRPLLRVICDSFLRWYLT